MTPFYTDKIKYVEINHKGNDYVIGDIHGRYDLVEKALEEVDFNIEQDRLFCVGDLIDRGADSAKVHQFLSRPYVYATRGNHEDMLLEIYHEHRIPDERIFEEHAHEIGLEWWLDVNHERRMEILSQLKQLPLVIEIETVRGKVGLVHADVPRGLDWEEFKEEIMNDNPKVIAEAMWGRNRISYKIDEDIEKVGRVYVGHTVQDKVRKYGNVVAIDTGAVFNQHLTLLQIECQTKFIVNAKKPSEHIQIINPTDKSILPFGETYLGISSVT